MKLSLYLMMLSGIFSMRAEVRFMRRMSVILYLWAWLLFFLDMIQ